MHSIDFLVEKINSKFSKLTNICLVYAAKYQEISPQSHKANKTLLDLSKFPNICEIEEDYYEMANKIATITTLINQLYEKYLKFIKCSAIFISNNPNPVQELSEIVHEMREKLDECEELFVKKATYFKKIFDSLPENEKQEFMHYLHPNEEEEEKESEEENENEDENDSDESNESDEETDDDNESNEDEEDHDEYPLDLPYTLSIIRNALHD